MLKESVQWRKDNRVDELLDTYKPNEIFLRYFTIAKIGYDKEGRPLLLVRLGRLDFKGFLSCYKKEEILKYLLYLQEGYIEDGKKQNKLLGKYIGSCTVLVDADEFSMTQIASRAVLGLLRELVVIQDSNYPETMNKIIVMNVSPVFTLLFSLIRPVMHEATAKKFALYSKNDNWKKAILSEVDADQIPVYYGGTRTDGTGDPICPTVVMEGGYIPKDILLSKLKEWRDNTPGLRTLTVGKGSTEEVEVEVEVADSTLSWTFCTDDYDIAYGVYLLTAGGREEVVTKETVNSHVVLEVGQVICEQTGTYFMVFDNTSSYMRSKHVRCLLDVATPNTRL
jgi:hypothetical protein